MLSVALQLLGRNSRRITKELKNLCFQKSKSGRNCREKSLPLLGQFGGVCHETLRTILVKLTDHELVQIVSSSFGSQPAFD